MTMSHLNSGSRKGSKKRLNPRLPRCCAISGSCRHAVSYSKSTISIVYPSSSPRCPALTSKTVQTPHVGLHLRSTHSTRVVACLQVARMCVVAVPHSVRQRWQQLLHGVRRRRRQLAHQVHRTVRRLPRLPLPAEPRQSTTLWAASRTDVHAADLCSVHVHCGNASARG